MSGSAARGPPRLRPVARRESRGHQAVGAGERAARSLGRPAVDLPDASSPAFIRSSAAVCLVAVPLRLRSARCAPPPPAGEFAPSFRWGGGGSGVRAPGGAERRGQRDTGSATAAPPSLAAGCHLRSSELFLPHRRLFATKTMSAACRHLSGAALGRFTPDTCEYLLSEDALLPSSALPSDRLGSLLPLRDTGESVLLAVRERLTAAARESPGEASRESTCSEGGRFASRFYPCVSAGRSLPGAEGASSPGAGPRRPGRVGPARQMTSSTGYLSRN